MKCAHRGVLAEGRGVSASTREEKGPVAPDENLECTGAFLVFGILVGGGTLLTTSRHISAFQLVVLDQYVGA